MILISNIMLNHDFDFSALKPFIASYLNTPFENILSVQIYKKSIDARSKSNVQFCCSFLVEATNEQALINGKNITLFNNTEYKFNLEKIKTDRNIIIAGFGPAGIFAALTLARRGLKPIVLERGEKVEDRLNSVADFFNGGALNPNSNVQFGEGGAGTFSDGKLTTGIKDIRCKAVIKEFYLHGAQEEILYNSKPHIGTDVLPTVIKNIREEIISLGGQVLFNTKLTEIKTNKNKVCKIVAESPDGVLTLPCDYLILAIGHSSRDTFLNLCNMGIDIAPKAFAVGVRIEHSQQLINKGRLNKFALCKEFLPADYKLAAHLSNGRGVYTFCMCPGGSVVNASCEQGRIVTNGMSNSLRNGKNANSALLVGVEPNDFTAHALGGVYFQQEIEEKAYNLSGGYFPPAMTVGEFLGEKNTKPTVTPTVKPKPYFCNFKSIFPSYINESLAEGIKIFNNKLSGFSCSGALLTAPETRSSSPIRIIRGQNMESSLGGLIPCGEGAGYAGGIVSAAVDGIKCAESIIERIV